MQNIFKKWYLILSSAILFGLLGIGVAWLLDPKFTAKVSFTTESDKSSQLGLYSGIAAQFGIDLLGSVGGSAFEGDNLIEFFTSKFMIERSLLSKSNRRNRLFIEEFLLLHFPKNEYKRYVLEKKIYINPDSSNLRIRDSIISWSYKQIISSHLSVTRRDKKLSYIDLSYTDKDESFSQEFALQLTKTAIEYYTDYKSKKAKRNFDLLNSQTDSVRNLLYGNIEGVASSNDLNVNPLRQTVKTTAQKLQLNASANGALYTELLKQLGLARVNLMRDTPLIQIIDTPTLPLKNQKPGRLFMGLCFSFFGTLAVIATLLLRPMISKLNV